MTFVQIEVLALSRINFRIEVIIIQPPALEDFIRDFLMSHVRNESWYMSAYSRDGGSSRISIAQPHASELPTCELMSSY